MSLDPLSTAFTIFRFIQSCVQSIKTSKEQLGLLSTCTKELLTTLNTEFSKSRLVPEKCSKALADLETLLRDIHRFVETEKSSEFLKMLLQKDARLSKIAVFYRRIGMSIAAFQISSLLNIQTMLVESKKAQARDTEALHTYLSALERNNAKLLRTLEINQNNTIAMMVCIQKQLKNRNIDRAEQQFYTHTLEYLTSRSGTQVKVENWMISSFEVQYQEEIGSGGFGTVYRGTWNRTEVAIKVLRNEVGIRPSHAAIRNEIDIWPTLRHPNIVQFLGANTLDDKPFIVMPFVPYNAKDFLQERPTFNPLFILRDISLGLEYLHSRKISHGDLKGINVLVDNSERALLCDFGLARLKADTTARTRAVDALQIQGSRNWMAPELLNGSRHRPPSDVYAFSMTLYELYTNEIPLFSVPYADLVDLVVQRGGRPERPEPGEGRPIPQEVWELAERCWVAHPHERPTATQIHDAIEHMVSYRPKESGAEPTPNHLSTRGENLEDIKTRARELAIRCWKEDEDFLGKEKYAEWFGSIKPINKAALQHYINFFDFTGLRLDLAFRCVTFYLTPVL
ncbi:kinase-like domain-containing protein [Mycena olivaceomarginata]|nr:kinase-like domain-containing protein [Mycena olivaceomarginata]